MSQKLVTFINVLVSSLTSLFLSKLINKENTTGHVTKKQQRSNNENFPVTATVIYFCLYGESVIQVSV